MTIVFWILVILALICVWFGLTILFKPTGKLVTRIWKDTVDVLTEKEESEDVKNE